MRWKGRRQSSNVEDRRAAGGRSGGRFPMRVGRKGGGIGIGTIIILLVISHFLGINPLEFLGGGGGLQQPAPGGYSQQRQPSPAAQGAEDEAAQFISVVLADTEDTWNRLFQEQLNKKYQEPRLVLFRGFVQSACGLGQAAMGPFYCPADHKVYIDLSFYDDLKRRHGAPGDFAQAYVIAHEIGHHVQNLQGISLKVQQLQRKLSKSEANQLSVRVELQADCYAGLWAAHTQRAKNILEEGDLQEALQAAHAIGDDRLQKQSSGYVVPDSFTHGSSEQRARWFRRGLQATSIDNCNTFATDSL